MTMTMTDDMHPIGTATAQFIATARQRRLPPEVVDQAKMCLVDWMGVALGAHAEGAAVTVRRLADSWGASGKAQLLLGGTTTPALAAQVNGTMSHCLDYDDAHTQGAGHISAVTWAAAWAMAGQHQLSGADAVAAFVTGFEVLFHSLQCREADICCRRDSRCDNPRHPSQGGDGHRKFRRLGGAGNETHRSQDCDRVLELRACGKGTRTQSR
jgi:2-methylcitrate dehydratase PrpD